MISQEEALNIVLDSGEIHGEEHVNLNHALGRVLAEDAISDVDMPPFNKSAMDGFACQRTDLDKSLTIIETIAAGQEPKKFIGPGECSRIMTGARVPEGADCVIKVEDTNTNEDGTVNYVGEKTKDNIALHGEDVRTGDIVISKGTRIRPHHIAVMAAVGMTMPNVYSRPNVAIISTGDEIVEPENKPGNAQIRNSNGPQLYAQVLRQGSCPKYLGIARDSEEETYKLIKSALKAYDVLLLSGGVSMGEFDFIPKVFERLSIEVQFETVAVQPGKPTVFGKYGKKRIFGLPGNPVSSYNMFELFVKPLLNKMMGESIPVKVVKRKLGTAYSRKKAGRISWMPIRISEKGIVFPLDYHGSAHISALVEADGLMAIPVGVMDLKEGDYVDVRQI